MANSKSGAKTSPEPITLTTEQREHFLAALAKNPGAGHVAILRDMGVVGTGGQLRQIVQEQLLDDIGRQRGDRIRESILTRAIEGVEEPVYTPSGKLAGTKRVYSDRLLDLAARMYLVEAQQMRRVDIGNAGGRPFQVASYDYANLDDAERADLRALLEKAAIDETPAPDEP